MDISTVKSIAHAEGIVRAVVARADADVTPSMMRELADVDALPTDLRPALPAHRGYRRSTLAERALLPATNAHARRELDSLRRWIEATDLMRASTTTAASVHGMIRGIVARADSDIGRPELRQLAQLAGLPDELRPGYLSERALRLQRIDDSRTTSPQDGTFLTVRSLRRASLAHDVNLDPSATRASLTREAVDLLAKPVRAISVADVDRLGVIASVDAAKRPIFGGNPHLAPDYLSDHQVAPSSKGVVSSSFEGLRRWALRVDRPEATDLDMRMGVAVPVADAASIVVLGGVPPLRMADNMLLNVGAERGLITLDTRAKLEFARDLARQAAPDDRSIAAIHAGLVDSIERAVASLDELDSPNYVEYGELGRARASIALLQRLADRAPDAVTASQRGSSISW